MPVTDDLPPARDGGVTREGHERAEAEAAAEPPPRLTEGIDLVGEYEDSGFQEAPYIARRADGQMVQMAKLLYMVAEEIDGRRDYAEIGERVSKRFGRGLDAEMTKMLVDEKLRPLGVVTAADGQQVELKRVDPMLALKFRAAVVPESAVNAITRLFKPLYYPPVIAAVLAGLVVLDVWLFGFHGVAQSMRQTLYDPLFILLTLGLVALSAAFHECGHATAAAYGGARPGVMGAGVYIVWPAFYTDVTDAYRLGKGGRLRTDLGGIYFNAIFILATGAAYFATGFEPLLLLIPLQHLEILHQLLPFLRLDGYYVVADLTGVPDMFARIKPTLKSLLPWQETEDSVRELKPWVRVAVTAYVLTLVPLLLFFLALTLINVPRIFATAYDSGILTAHKLDDGVFVAIIAAIQLLVLVLVPLGLIAMFVQLARKGLGGAWRVTEGRPVARAGVVVAATALAGFAAYSWYPKDVYRPIQPNERGTVVGAVTQLESVPSGRPALTKEREQELGGAGFRSRGETQAPKQGSGATEPTSTTEGTATPTDTTTTGGSSTTPTAPAETTTGQSGATVTTQTSTTNTTTTATTATTATTPTTTTP